MQPFVALSLWFLASQPVIDHKLMLYGSLSLISEPLAYLRKRKESPGIKSQICLSLPCQPHQLWVVKEEFGAVVDETVSPLPYIFKYQRHFRFSWRIPCCPLKIM